MSSNSKGDRPLVHRSVPGAMPRGMVQAKLQQPGP
jgi:hypothetical protein